MNDVWSLVRPDVIGPLLCRATGDERWRETEAELIVGGKSNLTFRLLSPAGELILRRPPSGGILPTAHDMKREARVQRALAGTSVPVAEIIASDDGALLGVPFYVMASVPGLVIRGQLPEGFAVTGAERQALAYALADCLAALHRVDPVAVGLGDFGRPDGYLERQVCRWGAQWEASADVSVPAVGALAGRLAASIPRSPAATITHGDYRLDNCLIDPHDPGRLAAVLDWELSTLGDPLADLGMLLFYWDAAADVAPTLVPTISGLPGFPGGADIARRWADRTGYPLDDLDWYQALAHFKFAVITQGIKARVAAGAMGGQDFGDLAGSVTAIAEAGLAFAPP